MDKESRVTVSALDVIDAQFGAEIERARVAREVVRRALKDGRFSAGISLTRNELIAEHPEIGSTQIKIAISQIAVRE